MISVDILSEVALLARSKISLHIVLNAGSDVAIVGGHKFFAHDVLIEFLIASSHALAIFVGHLGHLLTGFAHKVVVDKPLAHKFLAQLTLWLAFFKAFLISVCIKIS